MGLTLPISPKKLYFKKVGDEWEQTIEKQAELIVWLCRKAEDYNMFLKANYVSLQQESKDFADLPIEVLEICKFSQQRQKTETEKYDEMRSCIEKYYETQRDLRKE